MSTSIDCDWDASAWIWSLLDFEPALARIEVQQFPFGQHWAPTVHTRGHPLTARLAFGIYRPLSPSIALKRNYLAVDLTVSSLFASENINSVRRLQVPETIEWE